ncbi:MAG: lamin tail domain-containing protein [Gemmatimonadota bacterium]|jgi:hypothetical protein|nr:lamin tail domain-containing protein [Gemmatimonadota bacterium]MDP6802468.1 lamin tail domain-containing protein [Gemmatimonadota bacterium]
MQLKMRSHFASATRIASLLLLAGSLALPAEAAVMINEFERASGSDYVELYNDGTVSVDLSGWTLESKLGVVIPLSGVISGGGYTTHSTSNVVLDGGEIELYDGSYLKRDEVAFGSAGGAPAVPPIGSYSCGRAPNGTDTGNDAADWNLATSNSLGFANTHPVANLNGWVAMNEVGFQRFRSSAGCELGATVVELFNSTGTYVDLYGWWVTNGRKVTVLFGMIAPNGFAVFNDLATGFCFDETEVIYLFGPTGRRFDQFGTKGARLPDESFTFQRVPDGTGGQGPFDGFDYVSSGGSRVLFMLPQTWNDTNDQATPMAADDPAIEAGSWGRVKALYR